MKLSVAKKVYHVIEIARAGSFRERSCFLRHDFFAGVATCGDATFGQIAIGVVYPPLDRRNALSFLFNDLTAY